MSTYRAATGHNVALGSLTVLSPQPDDDHPGGIQYTSVRTTIDGTVAKQAPFVDLYWSELTASQFSTLLSTFGVGSADNANVTVYVRDVDMSTWVRKNGVAQRPFPGDTAAWHNRPREIVIRVTGLVDSS